MVIAGSIPVCPANQGLSMETNGKIKEAKEILKTINDLLDHAKVLTQPEDAYSLEEIEEFSILLEKVISKRGNLNESIDCLKRQVRENKGRLDCSKYRCEGSDLIKYLSEDGLDAKRLKRQCNNKASTFIMTGRIPGMERAKKKYVCENHITDYE